jgi:hypothetical protein
MKEFTASFEKMPSKNKRKEKHQKNEIPTPEMI